MSRLALLVLTAAVCMRAASVPLLECSGLPCVEARTGQAKTLRLGIDTGDAVSTVDSKIAGELGWKLTPYQGSDGKTVPGISVAKVEAIEIGDRRLRNVTFIVLDLASQIAKGQMAKVDGTLSYRAFENRLLRLDYRNGKIEISDVMAQALACPGKCGMISLITFGKKGPPIVTTTGFAVNGKPVTAQVDSMYAGTLLVYPTSIEKLGLAEESKSRQVERFPFTDGGVDMFVAQAASLSFEQSVLLKNSALYFAGPQVHLPDGLFDATVGVGLFRGRTVTFDFKDSQFWIE